MTSASAEKLTRVNSDAAISELKSPGIPPEKLLLGIGFSGRGWTGVTRSAPGGSATGAAADMYEAGIEDDKVLKSSCPVTGTVAGTAYAHRGTTGGAATPRRPMDRDDVQERAVPGRHLLLGAER